MFTDIQTGRIPCSCCYVWRIESYRATLLLLSSSMFSCQFHISNSTTWIVWIVIIIIRSSRVEREWNWKWNELRESVRTGLWCTRRRRRCDRLDGDGGVGQWIAFFRHRPSLCCVQPTLLAGLCVSKFLSRDADPIRWLTNQRLTCVLVSSNYRPLPFCCSTATYFPFFLSRG